ncbi:hypothetical protein [Aestuariivita sp.]|uniref:hypothetical protein n=1 Tax=Aestuariivita sp. TaxID=1872407 RepID=UPI0021746112|nr:hypothetical protein [Aestuariivita sp.]MCE8006242.1 hypothetical protein [Aestuariivita sp.]
MSQTLRDFISARESEVRASIKALNDELRELRAAKSAIDGTSAAGAQRAPSSRITHRDMIVAVLDDRPEGGTSDKVIEWVNARFDVEISQASMSSQLSRAKSDGVVSLDMSTKTWRSAKHSGAGDGLPSATPQHENSEPAGFEEAKVRFAGGEPDFLNLQPSRDGQ